jgi:hypothetical protein
MARLMRRRLRFVEMLALGGISLVIAAPAASAATARTTAPSATTYSERDVIQAFAGVKIRLVKTVAGNESQYVTALTAVARTKITHTKPWAVAVWVYASESSATQAFKSGLPQWRANGIASARMRNIVVTVVPKGREIGSEGPAFPMPKLVLRALNALSHA